MILLIDTSQETGMVALSDNGNLLFSEESKTAREHAAWLHPAVGRILALAKISIRDLRAISVVAGPGSYTGLRVGMAAAKGFCYALKIPLITQNSLYLMADAMKSPALEKSAWICPMIDARREEVFTALYDINRQPPTANGQRPTANDLTVILPPQALILDKNAFETFLKEKFVLFSGSGAAKWKLVSSSPRALFEQQIPVIQSFASLTQVDFMGANWTDPVRASPVYLKEFFSY